MQTQQKTTNRLKDEIVKLFGLLSPDEKKTALIFAAQLLAHQRNKLKRFISN